MSVVKPDDPTGASSESSEQGKDPSGRVSRSVTSTSLQRLGVQARLRVFSDDTGTDQRDTNSIIAALASQSKQFALVAAVRDVLPMASWLPEDFTDPVSLLQAQRQCRSLQGTVLECIHVNQGCQCRTACCCVGQDAQACILCAEQARICCDAYRREKKAPHVCNCRLPATGDRGVCSRRAAGRHKYGSQIDKHLEMCSMPPGSDQKRLQPRALHGYLQCCAGKRINTCIILIRTHDQI
jgi:hypothetical protein